MLAAPKAQLELLPLPQDEGMMCCAGLAVLCCAVLCCAALCSTLHSMFIETLISL